MNNEPVAWINRTDGSGYLEWDKDDLADKSTPLYTHPAKTLTDEKQFKDAYMVNFLSSYMAVRYDSDCANGHPLIGYQPIEDAQFLANEAWAILRKAQEK